MTSPADLRPELLRPRGLVLAALVFVAAIARLLPHPPNLTPVGALALFAGAHFASRRIALLVPLAAMLVADLAFLALEGWPMGWMTVVIYACVAVTAWMGRGLGPRARAAPILRRSLAGALLFFGVTNFAVWVGDGLYPHTLGGLIACYTAAIPFFGNALAGFAVYAPLLFGGAALAERRWPVLASLPRPAEG